MPFSTLTSIVVVVIVLGVMILVHELGHFLAAKFFHVRVLVFSIGFGRRLFGFVRGDTDYRLSLLPLGGYVKMAGEDPTEEHRGDAGEFLAKPRWQRFVIALMGPTMNILMAIVLLAALYHFHFPKPAYMEAPARIGGVEPDSPAARAGLLPGDVVLRVGDMENPHWEDLEMKVFTAAGQSLPMDVSRDGKEVHLMLTPQAQGPNDVGEAGLIPCVPGRVGMVEGGLPAAKAGLQPGDRIIAIEGKPVECWQQLSDDLQKAQGKPVALTIERGGKDLQAQVTPVFTNIGGDAKWRIGVGFRGDIVVRHLSWPVAVSTSVHDNTRNTVLTFEVLGRILTRRMSARSLSGPIGIVQISTEAYRAGLPELLMLVSFISLQLGIFNLLPIPILDGGMILLLAIESLLRRDVSMEVRERFAQVGIVFLLLLAVFVTYNDIVKTLRPH